MALSAEVAAVVDRGRQVVGDVLDELRGPLLAAAGDSPVELKEDGTPVTAADHEADERLAAAIVGVFPDHGLVSEERLTVTPDAEWCWVVDPIDGTSNFLGGLPWWCVSVALAHRGRPVLALVDAPALDTRYTAVLGDGAQRDGWGLKVREPVDWRDGRNRHVPLMLSIGPARRTRAAGVRLNPRVMGSAALDLCAVAEGTAAGSLAAVPHVWDVAAGGLLVTEAGGVVRTIDDEPLVPLRPQERHLRRRAATAAGPTRAWVDELATLLLA